MYELHITMIGNPSEIKPMVECLAGWHFSKLDGDIELGDGIKCYATAHPQPKKEYPDLIELIGWVEETADQLREQGATVVRRKVEFIHYDRRS